MLGKTKLVAIIIILVTSFGISNLAYAHVDICAGSDNGKPFTEIWAAICDLQGQIDNIEKKHNDQLVNVGLKRVHLDAQQCTSDPTNPTPRGWCPDGINAQFLITEPALTPLSVVSLVTVPPASSGNSFVNCHVDSLNLINTLNSAFVVLCGTAPVAGTGLNYIVFFDSVPFQVGADNSNPPSGTVNNPHDDDNKKSKSHDDDDNKKSKSHDDDDNKKSKSHDDDRK